MDLALSPTASRGKNIAYWTVTGLLTFGMLAGGIAQLVQARPNVEGMIRLGYPTYVLPLLALWKIAGVGVLLLPGWRLVKEWAYAGYFFLLTGAVVSHIVAGDTLLQFIAPLIFAILTVLSWYWRPASRRLPTARPTTY